jgi:signal transduction histidine kinase
MDYFSKYKRQIAIRIVFLLLLTFISTFSVWYVTFTFLSLGLVLSLILTFIVGILCILLSTILIVGFSTEATSYLLDIVDYAAHTNREGQAPNLNELKIGNELIQAQSLLIYDLASTSKSDNQINNSNEITNSNENIAPNVSMIDFISTPVFGLDKDQIIISVNNEAASYLGLDKQALLGKPIYDCLNLSFQGDLTFSDWLESSQQNSVKASKAWNRVKHVINEDNSKQFDMVASFSKDNETGVETTLVLLDKTEMYTRDDQEVSYVALAVHELRTPLTIMRGYIEVFEDELGPSLAPELKDFMHKMHASAQQLAAFVSNILNVARIEENQLALKLRKEDWSEILKTAISDLELRARVHGKHIELSVAENIPPVAADRISIHEVINNLVDNAIKYSGKSEKITVTSSVNSEGLIETSIQDYGIGIPESVMGRLFQKFHRSHRSSVEVGGTGLGLYLSKALVGAHGGNIWVRSKEGEGSIFTFTLMPFDKVSSEQVEGEDGIIRGAHGWIKNHSLYRN